MPGPHVIAANQGLAFEDGADRGRVIVSGADTGGRYALMEYVVAPCFAPAPDSSPRYGAHLHREMEETFLVRAGRLEFLIGEEILTLGPGDVVRVPPGVRHGYANLTAEPVELLVTFHPGGFEQLFVKYRTDRDDPPGGEGFIAEATRRFASEFEDG